MSATASITAEQLEHSSVLAVESTIPPGMTFAGGALGRAVRHLAAWVDYHSGGGGEPSSRPARLTYHSS